MNWFRHWVGMASDPKFGVIAQRVGKQVRRSDVVMLWDLMLEHVAEREHTGERGTLAGFDHESAAFTIGIAPELVAAIYGAMKAKKLHDGTKICAWERRQPESDSSAKRMRRHRALRRQRGNGPVAPGDGDHRHTPPRDVTVTASDASHLHSDALESESEEEESPTSTQLTSRNPRARARPPGDDSDGGDSGPTNLTCSSRGPTLRLVT
jgi:hypothetical protein